MKRLWILVLLAASVAQGQGYPTKPIRLVVPFAPGGSSSIVARRVAAERSKGLGQEIYIENKGGGGGNLAMHDVARADPDGYSLIIGHVGIFSWCTPTCRRRTYANSSRSPRRARGSSITARRATAAQATSRWNT